MSIPVQVLEDKDWWDVIGILGQICTPIAVLLLAWVFERRRRADTSDVTALQAVTALLPHILSHDLYARTFGLVALRHLSRVAASGTVFRLCEALLGSAGIELPGIPKLKGKDGLAEWACEHLVAVIMDAAGGAKVAVGVQIGPWLFFPAREIKERVVLRRGNRVEIVPPHDQHLLSDCGIVVCRGHETGALPQIDSSSLPEKVVVVQHSKRTGKCEYEVTYLDSNGEEDNHSATVAFVLQKNENCEHGGLAVIAGKRSCWGIVSRVSDGHSVEIVRLTSLLRRANDIWR